MFHSQALPPKMLCEVRAVQPRVFAPNALRDAHVDEVRALMTRTTVDWGATDAAVLALPTQTRLARYGSGESDPTLEQALYDFGRYLLLSSSRPGGLPANPMRRAPASAEVGAPSWPEARVIVPVSEPGVSLV